MLGVLSDVVAELRAVGVPVSMVETIDAAHALRHIDLADPQALRASLGATLVKNEHHQVAFHAAFDVFFGLRSRFPPDGALDAVAEISTGDGGDGVGSGRRWGRRRQGHSQR